MSRIRGLVELLSGNIVEILLMVLYVDTEERYEFMQASGA